MIDPQISVDGGLHRPVKEKNGGGCLAHSYSKTNKLHVEV